LNNWREHKRSLLDLRIYRNVPPNQAYHDVSNVEKLDMIFGDLTKAYSEDPDSDWDFSNRQESIKDEVEILLKYIKQDFKKIQDTIRKNLLEYRDSLKSYEDHLVGLSTNNYPTLKENYNSTEEFIEEDEIDREYHASLSLELKNALNELTKFIYKLSYEVDSYLWICHLNSKASESIISDIKANYKEIHKLKNSPPNQENVTLFGITLIDNRGIDRSTSFNAKMGTYFTVAIAIAFGVSFYFYDAEYILKNLGLFFLVAVVSVIPLGVFSETVVGIGLGFLFFAGCMYGLFILIVEAPIILYPLLSIIVFCLSVFAAYHRKETIISQAASKLSLDNLNWKNRIEERIQENNVFIGKQFRSLLEIARGKINLSNDIRINNADVANPSEESRWLEAFIQDFNDLIEKISLYEEEITEQINIIKKFNKKNKGTTAALNTLQSEWRSHR
jgi:hypothetical protein